VTTLDDLLDAGDQQRDKARDAGRTIVGYARVGLWGAGWLLAKLVVAVCATIAGLIFGIGWCCARVVPVLKWMRNAFMLGWEAGRPPGGRVAS
jgi:hypothetical protein